MLALIQDLLVAKVPHDTILNVIEGLQAAKPIKDDAPAVAAPIEVKLLPRATDIIAKVARSHKVPVSVIKDSSIRNRKAVDARRAAVRLLRQTYPTMTQTEIATVIGMSKPGIHFALRALNGSAHRKAPVSC